MKLTVVHLEGSKQGLTETISGQVITIGRDPSNTLSFDPFKDLDVSTRHASITAQGEQAVLQDLGSTNGTFLNGDKIQGTVPLPNGCILQFGGNGPKVQVSYSLSDGPGKKTQMISDLSSKLEQEEAARKKGKKKVVLGACCLFLLLGIGVGGLLGYQSHAAGQALAAEVAGLKEEALEQQRQADNLKATQSPSSKKVWDQAVETLEAADRASQAGELAEARHLYAQASKQFDRAGKEAGLASQAAVAALEKELASAAGAASEERKALEAKEAEERKRIEEERAQQIAEREAQLAEVKKQLELARGAQAIKEQALKILQSKDPAQLKQGIEAVEGLLATLPADAPERADLEPLVPKLKDELDRYEKTPEQLEAAAQAAKEMVFALRSRVFALPRGQTPRTTRIRYPIAEGSGTGFLASDKGHVVTAKEVVEPHLFQPEALARTQKLEQKGMKVFVELELLASVAGVYTSSQTGEAIQVARRSDDSFGDAMKVEIDFDNAKAVVEVSPHRRDEAAVVVLKVEALAGKPALALAERKLDELNPIVSLGVQKEDQGEALALFSFTGNVTEIGPLLGLKAPSFSTWLGGPVLDPSGKVVGVLVEPGSEESRAAHVDTFRSALR